MTRRRCIVDASSTLRWLFREGEEGKSVAEQLRALDPVVPPLWRLEVTHTLLKRQRTRANTPEELRALLMALDVFPAEVLPEDAPGGLTHLFDRAKPHQLSSYDAVYLDAALRHGLPLLTHDRNLRLAAEAEGVELL